ncbi:hypothetical protein KY306_01890 [Candidatus Woesearchaeota archaeon]|nr:hypothetical protein [Candidatus Woesearchaeota archaeon]
MVSIFKLIGALGIILIAIGIIIKKRKIQDIFYIFGGLCLETYSIYINDLIFIILQIIFTLAAVYDLIKIQFFKKSR